MGIDIDALISGAKRKFDEAEPEDLTIDLGGEPVAVRLWPVSGAVWRELTLANPARTEQDDEGKTVVVQADRAFGYNADALTYGYPRVSLVKDDETQELDRETWGRILGVMDGLSVESVTATIWALNVQAPMMRMVAAGKAFRAAEQTKLS